MTPLYRMARGSKKILQKEKVTAPEIVFVLLLHFFYGGHCWLQTRPSGHNSGHCRDETRLGVRCADTVGSDWEPLLSLGPLFYYKLLCPCANFPHLSSKQASKQTKMKSFLRSFCCSLSLSSHILGLCCSRTPSKSFC